MLQESASQSLHGRPFKHEVGFTPLLRGTGVALPFLGNAHPAGEAQTTVTDQDLAVGPMIQLPEAPRMKGSEVAHLDGRLGHEGSQLLVHGQAPRSIQQHPHLDAAPCLPMAKRTRSSAVAWRPLRCLESVGTTGGEAEAKVRV